MVNQYVKGGRAYLGWEDAAKVDWQLAKEYEGRKNWRERWGKDQPWTRRYEKWVCSNMKRAMRKPSFRSLEWLAYDRKAELAPIAEVRTRLWNTRGKRNADIRDYFLEPIRNYHCCPKPWPVTTAEEIGWLSALPCCQLEIYGNKFMQQPPMPWYMPKISSFLANSQ